jgi:LPXTG-site transpeptidase (sortase) family protein
VLVSLSIPSVGINDTLSPQGLNAQGELEPPPRNTIWYTGSPLPGQPGVSVIAGHDEWSGPSNFWSLNEVKNGALIYVKCKGTVLTFEVKSSYKELKEDTDPKHKQHPQDAMHDASIWNFDGSISSPELVVITCYKFSPVVNHHHLSNFVVHATLVSASSS